MTYVELHCHSSYSFLDGASLPEELAARAAELGYEALALSDHDGVYGSLEFAHAAKALGVRPITGAEVTLAGGAHVTLLVETARGYANLCRILTAAHAGTRMPGREDREPLPPAVEQVFVEEHADGLVCLSGCARSGLAVRDPGAAARLARAFGRDRFLVELQRPFERGDVRRNAALRDLAERLGVDTVATGNVHAHAPRRTLLQDTLVAIRCRASLDGSEQERRGNRESVLHAPAEMADRFATVDPSAVERAGALAERLTFDLTQELGYRYPDFCDGAEPAIRRLAAICHDAFADRYPARDRLVLARARARLETELALVDELGLAGFFLLHWEVLELARECALQVRGRNSPRRFLPPGRGRGSSVGSIVCYLTGLSHVDPVTNDLSLGRFLNRELASVPDIDLDFPRDIREKLIVAVSERYGHEHAALVASFATYRSRGAIRDVGKALGLPHAELERLARVTDGWDAGRVADEVAALPDAERKLLSKRWRAFRFLTAEIARLPRHISQHPGGMVISSRPLIDLVPVQPAAMAGRRLCQWDKDSCADAGFLKIDLLGLGMLSAVEECVERIAEAYGEPIDLSRIPLDDPGVFAEIQRADTVGTFQIESRAQMQSLLRTKPETIDDLTVQVALVRPGPIQGKAVHPYIEHRRRLREDPSFVYPVDHESLREPLASTLGVVVFQDQVLDVAVALAGFSVGEAEGLRRAMSRKRSRAALEAHRVRFVEGAMRNGVAEETANLVYDKLVGFSGFGFPKSHAAAFGLLAYQSQWLRHHYPAEFLCALLNAQPMGFYPPASLVRDAQRRGVEVLSPDVNLSGARCSLEPLDERAGGTSGSEPRSLLVRHAVRVGLVYVQSVGEDDAAALVAEREANGPYVDVGDLARRTRLSRDGLVALVEGGACDAFGPGRRDLLWELGLATRPRPVPGTQGEARQLTLSLDPTAATPPLRDPTRWERMLADYRRTGLSVGTHPLALLRPHLPPGTLSSVELHVSPHGAGVAFAGLVIARQRPATAKGIVFMLLEDEHGQVNLIVPSQVYERHRAIVRGEPLLLARGRYERVEEIRNVVVSSIETLAPLARRVAALDVGAALPRAHHFGQR
ncbi:polc: DNA polymerase III, alpha subunit [Gaiella occulta]|uniref:DNA-directed DNA polymerase n=1 Tax=Gaiella occulta TaxID=1002870 RepID=A0A7M2Z026_9ACTN|nr:error-prone DNA polymerase [Gaiella occulta]RDI75092.1 polc: DNA polymerase III, alpha subunit [Gaiella occulta]